MQTQDKQSQSYIPSSADRKFCRGDVAITAHIRALGGIKNQVNIVDLSETGFRMESLTYMSNDQVIFLTVPGFQQMEARIIWQSEWMYGCEFARSLHPAVYDHIVNSHPSMVKAVAAIDGFIYGAAAGLQWSEAA